MNNANGTVGGIKLGMSLALLLAFTGCVGYVDPGYVGGTVVVPGPDFYWFGGGERGRDVRGYSHRGAESRGVAHGGGGHGGRR